MRISTAKHLDRRAVLGGDWGDVGPATARCDGASARRDAAHGGRPGEALRCRVHAHGRQHGAWTPAKEGVLEPVPLAAAARAVP